MLGVVGDGSLTGKAWTPSPNEAVSDFIQARNNYFDQIELARDGFSEITWQSGIPADIQHY